MAVFHFTLGNALSLKDDSSPNSGGKAYFYEPGTATAKTTYSDSALFVDNTNPVIFDSAGRASIYFEGNADVKIYNSLDVLLFSQPNVNPVANSTVSAITANTTLAAAHNLNTIEASGSITLTLTSAVTLGSGWFVYIRNIGTSNITLDRANVGNSINGTVANYTIRPSEAFRIIVNAAATGFITDTLTAKDIETKGADIASAATTDIGAATGSFVDVTGTTTITALGTVQAGIRRTVRFTGALVLTHNATSLILPGGTNITTAASDVAEFISLGSGNWVCVNYTTAAWSTGDVKLTLKAAADTGWVLMNDGTIGNASSGGTTRANADTEALYTLLWTNIIDTWAPVSTGRGASAAADYAANKTITLPRALGRALAVSGSGATLTARVLGEYLGTETHTLTAAEMPTHNHGENVSATGSAQAPAYKGDGGANIGVALTSTAESGSGRVTTDDVGSGGAHANMQPSAFLNVMIKL